MPSQHRPFRLLNMTDFVEEITNIANNAGKSLQLVPMRISDLKRGCKVRFRIGSSF